MIFGVEMHFKISTFFFKNTFYRGTPRIFFLFLGCLFNDDTRFELMIWKKNPRKKIKNDGSRTFLKFLFKFLLKWEQKGAYGVKRAQMG